MPPHNLNVFQVTVFGSGYGESIVVHVGNNEWIIIDSCLDTENGRPCAINYLESLGVDMATAVKHVFASHWDTDHIRGLAEIVRLSKNATFHVSGALDVGEFLTLLYGQADLGGLSQRAVTEFLEIIEELKRRKEANAGAIPLEFATESKLIERDKIFIDRKFAHREIITLSPSSAAIMRGQKGIASLIPGYGQPRTDVTRLKNNNHTSVVMWIKVAETGLLLGSDLEEIRRSDDGWENVVNLRTRPDGAKFFKIPHHGSETGHHERVWQEMIDRSHISVVTSFNHGKVRLPYIEDIRRIAGYSDNSYLAGALVLDSKAKFDRETDKTLRKLNKAILRMTTKTGRLTLSKEIHSAGAWDIECSGHTKTLKSLAA